MKLFITAFSFLLSLSVFGQNVYIPDANFKAYLVADSWINTNGDAEIQVSEANSYNGSIICANMNISDLTGIEYFTAISVLVCSGNNLDTLDVSQNTFLVILDCSYNQLTMLTLNFNSQNYYALFCDNNQLTSLDLSQANCSSFVAGESSFISNPDLYCIEVTNVSCWQSNFEGFIDITYQHYSTNCTGTAIQEHTTNKELIKVTDLLGREVNHTTNQILFHIYDDGSVEKKFLVE